MSIAAGSRKSQELQTSAIETAGADIERDVDRISDVDILEAVLPKGRIDPDFSDVDEGHGDLTLGKNLADRQPQIADAAIAGSQNPGPRQVKLSLLKLDSGQA